MCTIPSREDSIESGETITREKRSRIFLQMATGRARERKIGYGRS
jgi:hypothetical protein